MAKHDVDEQRHTSKLLILSSLIALLAIAAVNTKISHINITGAYSSSGGGAAVGLFILVIGLVCALMLLHKEDMKRRK